MAEVGENTLESVKSVSNIARLPEPPGKSGKLASGEDVLNSLQTEHAYMQSLMVVLQQQTDLLEQGLQPDYALMSMVVDYLDSVSDASHHPRENILFKKLLHIDPGSKAAVEPLITAHEAIEQKTDNLLESLKAALAKDSPANVDQVRRQANDYLKHLKKHLSSEERLYALIAAKFSHQDWLSILDKLQPQEDPVFGRRPDERYHRLYEHLREDLQQRAEDYALAEYLSLGAFTEMLGSVARNSGRLSNIFSSGIKEIFARDRATVKRLLRAENRSVSRGIELTVDCILDDYDTWVEKLSEVGHVLRDVRSEVAESFRSHEKIFHDVVDHD